MGEEKKARMEEGEIVEPAEKSAPGSGSSDMFWKVVVVALFAVVVFQTALLYKTRNGPAADRLAARRDNAAKAERQQPVLKPRTAPQANIIACQVPRTIANNQSNTCQSLAPPPLPHLNVNVNPKGCRAPVITAAPRQPRQQRQMPSYQSFASQQPGGMSIHISQFPSTPFGSSFGPSFGMDIQQEMARMERMMNAMMNSSMMGFGANFPRFPSFPGGGIRSGGATFSILSPSIKEEKGNYVVRMKIPGLDKTQVDAKVDGQMLIVSGTKREDMNKQGQGFQSYSSSLTSFHNSFPLPGPVKAEGLKVEYDKDTLTVRIPKKK